MITTFDGGGGGDSGGGDNDCYSWSYLSFSTVSPGSSAVLWMSKDIFDKSFFRATCLS